MSRDEGQATVMVVGIALVCFAIAGLAVDGTRVFLARRALQGAADGAATAGAAELDTGSYYRSGGRVVALDPDAARRVAARYLARRPPGGRATVTSTPRVVTVRLQAEVATTWLGLVGIRELPVAATARSRPVAGAP